MEVSKRFQDFYEEEEEEEGKVKTIFPVLQNSHPCRWERFALRRRKLWCIWAARRTVHGTPPVLMSTKIQLKRIYPCFTRNVIMFVLLHLLRFAFILCIFDCLVFFFFFCIPENIHNELNFIIYIRAKVCRCTVQWIWQTSFAAYTRQQPSAHAHNRQSCSHMCNCVLFGGQRATNQADSNFNQPRRRSRTCAMRIAQILCQFISEMMNFMPKVSIRSFPLHQHYQQQIIHIALPAAAHVTHRKKEKSMQIAIAMA